MIIVMGMVDKHKISWKSSSTSHKCYLFEVWIHTILKGNANILSEEFYSFNIFNFTNIIRKCSTLKTLPFNGLHILSSISMQRKICVGKSYTSLEMRDFGLSTHVYVLPHWYMKNKWDVYIGDLNISNHYELKEVDDHFLK